jgi:hypothetical protein
LVLGPDDPPPDFSRELAVYAREEERLVRDHLGKIALIHGDDVVGAYATADEAGLAAFRLFGNVRVFLHEIRDPKQPPDFISTIDFNHPSFKKVD